MNDVGSFITSMAKRSEHPQINAEQRPRRRRRRATTAIDNDDDHDDDIENEEKKRLYQPSINMCVYIYILQAKGLNFNA